MSAIDATSNAEIETLPTIRRNTMLWHSNISGLHDLPVGLAPFGGARRRQATLYTVLLPLNSNDGVPVPPEHLEWVQHEILRYAGGLTAFAPGAGLWVNGLGQLFKDMVLPLVSVISNSIEAEEWFAELAARIAVLFEQEAVLIFAQQVWILEPVASPQTADVVR